MYRKNVSAVAFATALTLSTAAHAAGRDPFIGEYGGDCGNKVQCRIEITKKGKSYDLTFLVSDRMDDSKRKCTVKAKMTRGNIVYSPGEIYPDGLNGEVKGSFTYLAPLAGGEVIIGGAMTAGLACGKYIMQQVYSPIGDY